MPLKIKWEHLVCHLGNVGSKTICQVKEQMGKYVPDLKHYILKCYRTNVPFIFHSMANTGSIGRNDWYKKMRIVLATCIDYMLAPVYGFRMPIRVPLFGVRIDITTLHYDP